MKNIVFDVIQICKYNRDGSFGTQAERRKVLTMAMKQVVNAGYRLDRCKQLKQKHIKFLVKTWQEQGLSAGSIKNRLSYLRWLAAKINKARIVERENDAYDVEKRKKVDNHKITNKTLSTSDLDAFTCKYLQFALRLQAEFGLRREEAMKFQVKFADRESEIVLMASWCKGGRKRTIPVRTESQRELLNEIHVFCKLNHSKSLIPPNKTYKQQLSAYEYHTEKNGVTKNHGLRHQYAQTRYKELTGWDCPKQGGKTAKQLSESEKRIDLRARLQISQELGHNREEVTESYLGR